MMTELEAESKLRNCPFCDCNHPKIYSEWHDFHRLLWVECPSCHVRTMKHFSTKTSLEELIKLWNSSSSKQNKSKRVRYILLSLPLGFAMLMKDFFSYLESSIKKLL